MNEPVIRIIRIIHFLFSERHIADDQIKAVICQSGTLERTVHDRHIRILIMKSRRNFRGDRIDLHTDDTVSADSVRHPRNEIARTAGRFQYPGIALQAHTHNCLVHCVHDKLFGIVRVGDGRSDCCILILRQQPLQFFPVCCVPIFRFVKHIAHAAPAGIPPQLHI